MKSYLAAIVKKLGIPQAAIEDLNAVFAMGKPSKVAIPRELLPIGARLVAKGLWNTIFSGLSDDYVLPYWMEKQFRPTSSSFIPRGHILTAINSTHRNWTGIGLPNVRTEAFVDPRGLVSPRPDAYSLDTYLYSEGYTLFPSRHSRVQQTLEHLLPIVITDYSARSLRLRQTNFVAILQKKAWLVHHILLVNTSIQRKEGFVAVSIRPFNVEGVVPVRSFACEVPYVSINEKEEIVLQDEPEWTTASNYRQGDIAQILAKGEAEPRASHSCEQSLLTAALVYPFALQPRESKEITMLCRLTPTDQLYSPGAVAYEEEKQKIMRFWKRRTVSSTKIETSLSLVNRAFEANKNFCLMLVDGDSITPGVLTYHHFWFRDAAYQIPALEKLGFHKEAEAILRSYPRRQQANGFFVSQEGEWDSNGQAIYALTQHFLYTRDRFFLEDVFPSIKKGVEWILRMIRKEPYGILPPGFSTEHGGPNDYFFWDNFWSLAGIDCAIELARELQHMELAKKWQLKRQQYWRSIVRAMKESAGAKQRKIIGATPTRLPDSAIITNLCAVYPLQLLDANHPVVKAWVRFLLDRYCQKGVYYHAIIHSGLNIYLTLHLAHVLLMQGDPLGWDLFISALNLATKTYTFPEAIHPGTKGGCMGDGHHGWAVAEVIHFTRSLFFLEYKDYLHLFPASIKTLSPRAVIEQAPSRFGRVSLRLEQEKKTAELTIDADFRVPPNFLLLQLPQKPKLVEVDGKPWETKKELYLPSTLHKLKVSF